jgi:GntR family transcriptional regulator
MRISISNTSSLPIYEQILQQIKRQLFSGVLSSGDKLPSIRSLAKDLTISVITTRRAYEELEKEGFINQVKGKGSFVAEIDKQFLMDRRNRHIKGKLKHIVKEAKVLGIDQSTFNKILNELFKEVE